MSFTPELIAGGLFAIGQRGGLADCRFRGGESRLGHPPLARIERIERWRLDPGDHAPLPDLITTVQFDTGEFTRHRCGDNEPIVNACSSFGGDGALQSTTHHRSNLNRDRAGSEGEDPDRDQQNQTQQPD